VFLVVFHFSCGTGKTLLVSEWEQWRVFVNRGKTCSDSGYDFRSIHLILGLLNSVLYELGTTFQEGSRPDFRNVFFLYGLVIDDRRTPRLEDYFETAMNIQDL